MRGRPIWAVPPTRAVAVSLFVAAAGWQHGALSRGGAWAAVAVGTATFGFGGLPAAAALVAFFVSGSWLSRRSHVAGEVGAAKGQRRDQIQVLANGGVAALGALAAGLGVARGHGAVLGALAAAAADTWASEVGVGSPTPPRSIVTGQIVRPGTSGGVTRRGWLAALGGALAVGGASVAAGASPGSRCAAPPLAVLAGLTGSLVDSLVGATVQAAYVCRACGAPSEAARHSCGAEATLVRGRPWVTNDLVNLIGTLAGGLVGAIAWSPEPCATLGRARD